MTVIPVLPPRPDLRAHCEAASLPFPELVRKLAAIVREKLTAYIGSVSEVRVVDRWMQGSKPYKSASGLGRIGVNQIPVFFILMLLCISAWFYLVGRLMDRRWLKKRREAPN